MIPDPHVRLLDVTRVYTGRVPVTALAGVSLTIAPGERLALLGKSGSGKSTVLNILGGLDRPTSGIVAISGQDLALLDSPRLADYRLRTVGVVFQSFNLITSRTALDNVELPLVFAGVPKVQRRRRALEALAKVGLEARTSHRPTELSGGETQRVAIARALINDPQLVLADEPTGNLDSSNAAAVMELLLGRVRERGTTLVLVTHDEELARRSADRIVYLRDGRLE